MERRCLFASFFLFLSIDYKATNIVLFLLYNLTGCSSSTQSLRCFFYEKKVEETKDDNTKERRRRSDGVN